jgi:restriction endonuclease
MKKFLILLLMFLTVQAYSQNDKNRNKKIKVKYEDVIAEKACTCLSKLDSIPNTQDALTKCIIESKNKVHDEDLKKIFKRDYTVEGIRKLHKDVTELLIANCEIVSKND